MKTSTHWHIGNIIGLIFVVSLASIAKGDDQISVTVNGQTYQCSGSPHTYKYVCRCERGVTRYDLNLYQVDMITGHAEYVRTVGFAPTQEACLSNLQTNGECR